MSESRSNNFTTQKVPMDQTTKDALKNLGFTDYYWNIYLRLLSEGEMNAHDLSDKTGVPYSRIYEVLNEMIRKMMITKIDGRPSTFVANNPRDVVQEIKKQREEEFQTYMQASLEYLNKLSADGGEAKIVQFNLHQGKKSCMDHIRNIITSTVKSFLIQFKEMDELYPEISKNLDFIKIKGVQMKILLEPSMRKHPDILENLAKFGEIRFTPQIDQNLVISDEKIALQTMKGHFNIAKPSDQEYALFSGVNTIYAMYLTELFQTAWNTSKNE
jgi:sugar-specific transcriptional regulator TrmB